MPAAKKNVKKSIVKVRDLGQGAKKGLGKGALKGVRGGISGSANPRFSSSLVDPRCRFDGVTSRKCSNLTTTPEPGSGKLTVDGPLVY